MMFMRLRIGRFALLTNTYYKFLINSAGKVYMTESERSELLAIGLQAATRIGRSGSVVDAVQRSPDGVYCLMCLDQHYGLFGASIDNGTYYCPLHRKEIWFKYLNENLDAL